MVTRKAHAVEVDFAGVESGGGRPVDDGEYLAQVSKIEEKEGESSGQPYLAWQWKIVEEGEAKGATVYDNTSLTPQSLWRLRSLLECIGIEVPDGKMRLVLDQLVGKRCRLEITNETYQGKEKPRVTGFLIAAASKVKAKVKVEEESDDSVDDEGEDDAPKFKKGQKVRFKDEDGSTVRGKVVSVDDDVATVEVDGDEWQVEVDQLKAL